MTQDSHPDTEPGPQRRSRTRWRLRVFLALFAVVVLLLVVPPLVSVNRYKKSITELVSNSLQRPVRLSSVELRILPWPGFVLSDLIVEGDPSYEAEPVLQANTVTASIRLWSLWRGKLQISRISVDEASLNLVHTPDGRWNIDALFRTAAAQQHPGEAAPFPYMEATNSRINVKNGAEKLPFSLVNADASLWQESGGVWRVRLRGQPARTDVSLDLADTGVVRLDATLHPAQRLEEMPLHLDLDWSEAQFGQLSRLLLGSDEGWRGNLTGELHLDGTVEAAQVKGRLRAAGVHRAEFAPAAPLDFDARCSFVFHSAGPSFEKILCDSPVGDGHAQLTGDLPGSGQSPHQSPRLELALDRIPAQAGLDVLRTVRSDLDPGLQAAGAVNGKLTYETAAPGPANPRASRSSRAQNQPPPGPLAGSLTVEGLRISGGALNTPVRFGKLLLEPAPAGGAEPPALTATVPISAGAPTPLTLNARLSLKGFQIDIHGPAALPRLRELARAAGFQAGALDQIAGEPAVVDLTADGPWLPSLLPGGEGSMTGTLALREANWHADWLAGPLLLSSATLHFDNGAFRWDPAAFSFGPVKGTATLDLPAPCDPPQECSPQLTVHFVSLDAAELQAALLGARTQSTLLSSLLARFSPSSSQPWPRLHVSAQADSLAAGPFMLRNADADLEIRPTGAKATAFHADALGGKVSGTGSLMPGAQPIYELDGDFSHLNPAQAGQLLGMKWTGGSIDGSATLKFSGYSGADLSSSAEGTLHFDWRHGSAASLAAAPVPPALARFDRWSADVSVAGGGMKLEQNQVVRGAKKSSVAGAAEFGLPAKVRFVPAEAATKPRRATPR